MILEGTGAAGEDFAQIRQWFSEREETRLRNVEKTSQHLTNSFAFLSGAFGEGQEMVIFLTDLSAGYYSLQFVTDTGSESYYKYNKLLLLNDRRSRLKDEISKQISI